MSVSSSFLSADRTLSAPVPEPKRVVAWLSALSRALDDRLDARNAADQGARGDLFAAGRFVALQHAD